MPPTPAQRSLIHQFMTITGTREKDAMRFLKNSNYKLEQACDSYYASTSHNTFKSSDTLGKVFEKYRAPTDETGVVSVEGTMEYLSGLGVNLENVEALVPLEIIQAPALGEMSKEGFTEGWRTVGADTLSKQKTYIQGQIQKLQTDDALFKRVYRHTFVCSKEKGQKALPLENALVYWEILFSPPGRTWATASTNWISLWLEYLSKNWTKSVNRDMWNQTHEFYQKSMEDESLSFWTEDGAWPGVIDEFVAYAKAQRGDAPESMETD